MVIHDCRAETATQIELIIEDLEAIAETPGDFEALRRLKNLRDRLSAARPTGSQAQRLVA